METPNMSYIKTLSGGNIAFENTLIKVIKEELPIEFETYQANIEKKNFKEASENVHKLKHKISILGLQTSYQIAVDYEENLKENSFILKDDFENILKTMIRFVNQL